MVTFGTTSLHIKKKPLIPNNFGAFSCFLGKNVKKGVYDFIIDCPQPISCFFFIICYKKKISYMLSLSVQPLSRWLLSSHKILRFIFIFIDTMTPLLSALLVPSESIKGKQFR